MFEQEYKKMFSKVSVSENIVNEVLNYEGKKYRASKGAVYLAFIAAVVCILVACTASVYDARPMLESIFGLNGRREFGEQTVWKIYYPGGERAELDMDLARKYLVPYVHEVQGSISDRNSENNTVLTAEAYILDEATKTGAVFLRMDNPPEYKAMYNGQIRWYKNKDIGATYWYIDPKPIGGNMIIGSFYIADEASSEDTLALTFLFTYTEETEGISFSFNGKRAELTIDFTGRKKMKNIQLADGNIILSAFGARFMNEPFGFDDPLQQNNIAIRYKNGEEYVLCSWEENDEKEWELYCGYTHLSAGELPAVSRVYIFNSVLDVKNVKSVIVNGTEYFPD